LVAYYAFKSVFQSAVKSYYKDDRKRASMIGEDMVQDPECRTYIPKGRAITRRIGGKLISFCSEACAKQYADKNRL